MVKKNIFWLHLVLVAGCGLPSGCGGQAAQGHAGPQFPDQGWNLCPLHCKADSQSLDHQRNPLGGTFEDVYCSSLNEGKIELQEGKEMEPHIVGR